MSFRKGVPRVFTIDRLPLSLLYKLRLLLSGFPVDPAPNPDSFVQKTFGAAPPLFGIVRSLVRWRRKRVGDLFTFTEPFRLTGSALSGRGGFVSDVHLGCTPGYHMTVFQR